jgi:uncharacterized membrane protein
MNNVTKILTTILMLGVVLIPPAAAQDANYIGFDQIEINGDEAEDGDTLFVERGDTLDIRASVEANDTIDVQNAQIEAWIAGYRYVDEERDRVTDYTGTFDLPAGNTRSFDMEIDIPVDMDQKNAKLRIAVSDENSDDIELYNYQLNIEGADRDNAVQVRDFVISPSTSIQAGRAASFSTRIQNYGDDDINDASLRVRIPELDLEVFESINELEADETQAFESLLLRIPSDAEPGDYTVEATVEFDRFESTTVTDTLTVTEAATAEDDRPEQQTRVTAPDQVDINAGGQTSVFPILIENEGSESQTYTLEAQNTNTWGTATFDPGNVVIVEPGQSRTVYLRLTADQTASGDKTFTVNIDADGDSNSFTAVANIQEAQQDNAGNTTVRTVLEWALVVLIVVLIVLGLVLLFRQGNNDDEEDDEDEPDYY